MTRTDYLDKLAIFLSSVCILHCLLAPVAITLIPVLSLSAIAQDESFHQLMLWVVVPTSVIALLIGCHRHRELQIAATGVIGMGILAMTAFWGHSLFGIQGEKIASIVGGCVLAISHYLNFRACQARRCDDDKCSSDHHH